ERLTGAPFAPQQLLVTLAAGADGDAIAAELERLAPGATISAASTVLSEAQNRPAIVALLAALLGGAILSFLLCAFAVVVSAVTASGSRS
ncbi:hypothetical protein, partial [Bacillus velezensis]|uniref:hypothetical protein n=1 Tax=Bacillus velezensis TaxID=492670 RepID=UPI003CEEE68F